ncbi:MAG: HEAT repeat domain-containing protein [Deltaproteobacteria bacterium]|nr:HEAT repeat domain-containing protein [Deltaproteobacteria bacterium]MBW1794758.1 HEAT repeat domain-containing protein [Deltaproteobacteria bacterium]MBW2330472.1 HEAT repeat domain-containing protein [Deltaproteobacteria bacterium]
MFKGRKITKLLEKYAEADTKKGELQMVSELEQFGKPAVRHTIEAFQQRKLAPAKAQSLLEKLCDDSSIEDIVPLIGESYDEVRRVAKEMIIKRWKKSSLPLLIEYLKSPDFYSRTSATELLATFKNQSCEPELVSMFNGADAERKRNIIRILSKTGGQVAKKLMISALSDESWQVRLSAVKSLGKMKAPESVDPLIERLTEDDRQMKRLALDALGAIGDKRAGRPMMELLKDDDLLIRQKATDYIIEIAESDIVPDVINLMNDKDVNVRRCAAEVLNNLKDPRTGDVLIKAIKDSDWWVRQIATDSLAQLKGDNVLKAFIAMTRDPDESIRRCAVEFFNKVIHKSALEPLIELLKDQDWWVREKAVTALAKLKDKRAIAPLAEMISDEEVKWVVPGALAEIGGDEVFESMKEFLFDDQKAVRIETIKALGKLKSMDAVSDLKECLKDTDKDVRSEAVSTLKQLTGKVFKPEEEPTPQEVLQAAVPGGSAAEGAILTEAILVVDLCRSTEIAARYGDSFALDLTRILTETVTPIARREKFRFMKSTGDGFLITFVKVYNSIRFAMEVLKQISKHNEKVDKAARIDLSFAINLGETRIDAKGDRLGVATNMTFRVEGVKPEGLIPIENGMAKEDMPVVNRILVTENVEKEIKGMEGIKTRMVGLFELKGITGLHKVYELTSVE